MSENHLNGAQSISHRLIHHASTKRGGNKKGISIKRSKEKSSNGNTERIGTIVAYGRLVDGIWQYFVAPNAFEFSTNKKCVPTEFELFDFL